MIHVGIGGWTYEPWRGTFFPSGLKQAEELAYASRRLTAIEINGTFYAHQKPATFRKWAAETPEGFIFSVKAHRATVSGRLDEAGPAIRRFVDSGIVELGDRLGPILWQLPPYRRFDPAATEAFLAVLPPSIDGRRLRHAIEVRHASFAVPDFVALARRHGIAIVLAESDTYPQLADVTGDFVYARLQRAREAEPEGYPAAELDAWACRFRAFAAGGAPDDLELIEQAGDSPGETERDCFVYFISGAKIRAPAAAEALIRRIAG